jgi:hypothetical protein
VCRDGSWALLWLPVVGAHHLLCCLSGLLQVVVGDLGELRAAQQERVQQKAEVSEAGDVTRHGSSRLHMCGSQLPEVAVVQSVMCL